MRSAYGPSPVATPPTANDSALGVRLGRAPPPRPRPGGGGAVGRGDGLGLRPACRQGCGRRVGGWARRDGWGAHVPACASHAHDFPISGRTLGLNPSLDNPPAAPPALQARAHGGTRALRARRGGRVAKLPPKEQGEQEGGEECGSLQGGRGRQGA